ncbi:hypothetical protein Lal_00001537 [Lupinus albus]|nr:hypothetical protein Lal_00001537 [Lupinus albus]
MRYAQPGTPGAIVSFKARYGNYIGGEFVPPVNGQYFTNTSPVNGQPSPNSPAPTPPTSTRPSTPPTPPPMPGARPPCRSAADPAEDRRPHRSQPGTARRHRDLGQRQGRRRRRRDQREHRRLPHPRAAGRGRPDHPVELSAADGRLELPRPWPPATAWCSSRRNRRPWHQRAAGADRRPAAAGVLNVVQGFGKEAGEALATSKRIAKIAFTGSTPVGRTSSIAPPPTSSLHRGAGRQEPEHLLRRHHAGRAGLHREGGRRPGAGLLQPGRGVHLPVRALVQESIYRRSWRGDEEGEGHQAWRPAGHRHHGRRPGLRAAVRQDPQLPGHRPAGRRGSAHRRRRRELGQPGSGYYIQPTLLRAQQDARVPGGDLRPGGRRHHLQGRGGSPGDRQRHRVRPGRRPVDPRHQPRLPHGPWHQGRPVWTNCYHLYPAHAAFGGYKKSGVGRETHKMMLDHYQQTKNLLVSYDINPLGFF